MRIEIQLPESETKRTHLSARVAAEYVAYELGKLDQASWITLQDEGIIEGEVNVEWVGVVNWTVYGD